MIDILENLTSLIVIPINLILAYVILWLANPVGFFITFVSLIYAVVSNTEGKNMENLRNISNYIKNYKQRYTSAVYGEYTGQVNIIKENKWTQQFSQIYYFLRSVFF